MQMQICLISVDVCHSDSFQPPNTLQIPQGDLVSSSIHFTYS